MIILKTLSNIVLKKCKNSLKDLPVIKATTGQASNRTSRNSLMQTMMNDASVLRIWTSTYLPHATIVLSRIYLSGENIPEALFVLLDGCFRKENSPSMTITSTSGKEFLVDLEIDLRIA